MTASNCGWPLWTWRPPRPNGRTVVLLHGRNFPSSYWAPVIKTLNDAGYPGVVGCRTRSVSAILQAARRTAFRHAGAQYHGAARSSRNRQGRYRRAFAGRHAGGADRARLSGTGSRICCLSRRSGLEDTGSMCRRRRRKNPGRTRTSSPPTATAAARDQLFAKAAAGTGDAVHRCALQHQGQCGISALAACFCQLREMIYREPVVHEIPLIPQPTLFIMGADDHNAPGRPNAPEALRRRWARTPNSPGRSRPSCRTRAPR